MPDEPPPPPLPPPPRIALTVARDRTAESRASGGFVNLRRVDLIATYPDGSSSPPFAYDVVDRASIDAVVILAYERAANGDREVYLRTATRVPLVLREGYGEAAGNQWELPAGMVDSDESPREAAVRELEEELGYRTSADSLDELGPYTWPAPGFVAERHLFYRVDVTGLPRGIPTEDGSPLERGASIVRLPLRALLAHCRAGHLRDAKTELALRRFAELA